MDLIPPYSYLETGYGPGGGGGGGPVYQSDTGADPQARRQRVVSGDRDRDRVVILPRRPSETESPDYVIPSIPSIPSTPRDMQQQHQSRRQDWRVPPHYPPDYAMPGESLLYLRLPSICLAEKQWDQFFSNRLSANIRQK